MLVRYCDIADNFYLADFSVIIVDGNLVAQKILKTVEISTENNKKLMGATGNEEPAKLNLAKSK